MFENSTSLTRLPKATCCKEVSAIMSKKSSNTERSFIMVKPDGVQRGLIGDIIKRFEQKGFKLVAMKFMQASEELLSQHYADLSEKPFFNGLVKFMSTAPVCAMVGIGSPPPPPPPPIPDLSTS